MSNQTAYIIYPALLDPLGSYLTVGGIQTYLVNLADVLSQSGFQPVLYQRAAKPFISNVYKLQVRGIHARSSTTHTAIRTLWNSVSTVLNRETDIVIFGTQEMSLDTGYERTLSIQHGVSWDIPLTLQANKIGANNFFLGKVRKFYQNAKAISAYRKCNYQVHVDHNYINWLRTQLPAIGCAKVWVIPNCAFHDVPAQVVLTKRATPPDVRVPLKVLFARRFANYRGVMPMLAAIECIRRAGIAMEFTFAGEGPLEPAILAAAKSNSAIQLTKYPSSEAVRFHLDFDIAVVPSIASEGTSLAVAEALAAGCAVITSGVGGISNMILDSFNGLLVDPNGESIAHAMLDLHTNRRRLYSLQRNAITTASEAFSRDQWVERWREVLTHFSVPDNPKNIRHIHTKK